MGGETPAEEVASAAVLPPADLLEDHVGVIEEPVAHDRYRSSPADDEDDNRHGEDGHPFDDGRDQAMADEVNLANLKQKIIRQELIRLVYLQWFDGLDSELNRMSPPCPTLEVEYYFSDENLPSDNHLLGWIKKNKGGFVPIRAISSFRKMKKLTDDQEFITSALKESSFLTVSTDGKKVKRTNPLPGDVRDDKLFTVLVENLPEDYSKTNLERMFGEAGKMKKICIHDPNSAEVSKKSGKIDKYLLNKLHALVEYETMEAAEKAVATLHNEEDWRNGMRVKLLKRMVKQGQKKVWKALDSEKNGAAHPSDVAADDQVHDSSQHDDVVPVEEDGDHIPKEKNEGGRNHARSRRHKHRGGMNGCGHGGASSSPNVDVLKPPPGPRMPDGTRGFTMGRGRPPVLDNN